MADEEAGVGSFSKAGGDNDSPRDVNAAADASAAAGVTDSGDVKRNIAAPASLAVVLSDLWTSTRWGCESNRNCPWALLTPLSDCGGTGAVAASSEAGTLSLERGRVVRTDIMGEPD